VFFVSFTGDYMCFLLRPLLSGSHYHVCMYVIRTYVGILLVKLAPLQAWKHGGING